MMPGISQPMPQPLPMKLGLAFTSGECMETTCLRWSSCAMQPRNPPGVQSSVCPVWSNHRIFLCELLENLWSSEGVTWHVSWPSAIPSCRSLCQTVVWPVIHKCPIGENLAFKMILSRFRLLLNLPTRAWADQAVPPCLPACVTCDLCHLWCRRLRGWCRRMGRMERFVRTQRYSK